MPRRRNPTIDDPIKDSGSDDNERGVGYDRTYQLGSVKSDGRQQDLTTVQIKGKKSSKKSSEQASKDFLAESLSIFRSIAENSNEIEIRKQALEEQQFCWNSKQWPIDIAELRARKGRPTVTINKVKSAVRIICNDQRQNRASIKVAPMDGQADKKTAEIFQGAIRHIETNSMSDIAIDKACEGQVTFGFGYVRLKVDFASPFSMDQEIIICRVNDPFSVYCGACSEPDYSDMNDCFLTEDVEWEDYKVRFLVGEKALNRQVNSAVEFSSIGNTHIGWGTDGAIRICERFWRTFETKELCQLSDGTVILKEQIPAELLGMVQIIKSRQTEVPVVHWCLFNAVEILEEVHDFESIYIPIIPVLGDDTIIDGKRVLSGAVKTAMEPSRQYNYFRSLMTETIGLAPKSPYVMAEGQNEGFQTMWDTANSENHSVMFYKPVSVNGQLAPPPQRQQSEPPIQAMVEAAIHYEQDIKATTMVTDAKLGARSNETSGAAINARKAQSDVSNYNYIDNRDRAIRHIGRSLINMIPRVYSTKNVMRIIGEDEESSMVHVRFDPMAPAYQEEITADDVKKIYNLSVGQYDVAIGVGPTYLSKRQEGFDMLTKLVNSHPELMMVAGDLIMDASDIPGAKAISKRLYAALDPKFKQSEGQQSIPPQVKQAFDQMGQQIQALTEQNKELKDMIQHKMIEMDAQKEMKQLDIDSKNHQTDTKAKTDTLKIQSDYDIGQFKIMADTMQSNLQEQMAKDKLEMSHKFSMIEGLMNNLMGHLSSMAQINQTAAVTPEPSPAA